MKIGIFTGRTSVRSKNIFTAISRYPTGKHEIQVRGLVLGGLRMEQNVQIKNVVDEFKGLLGELCNEQKLGSIEWTATLEKGIKLCESLNLFEKPDLEDGFDFHQLENISVELWNFSVTTKTRGSLDASSHAKMRHIAFKILVFSGQQSEVENLLKRQIMMGLKASKAWLECSKPEQADSVLALTEKCIMRLKQKVLQTSSEENEKSGVEKMKSEVDQDLFTLYCQRLEANIALDKVEEALKHMTSAKDLLPKFPKEGNYLAMMCYNTGVELYQGKKLDSAIVWLRESYELGKYGQSINYKTQARTLRLLANIYLELDPDKNLQNALNSVSLANKEHCHPAGLFLKLKILLLQNTELDVVKIASMDLIKLPELNIDLSVHMLQLICQQKRFQIVPWMIEELLKRFDKSPDIGKLLITNLEVLLEAGMIPEAKEFVEYCINAHHTGQPMDFNIKRRFHSVLWEQAALATEREDSQGALDWYNYSLSIYSKSDPRDMNLAKLHRNRTNCYLALQQLDKAREAIKESLQLDAQSIHGHFIMYKLAMLDNDPDTGCQSLQTLCELEDRNCRNEDGEEKTTAIGLIALAAQHALEHDHTEAAVIALERLSTCSQDEEQVLASLRCLIRLKLGNEELRIDEGYDVDCISKQIKSAHKLLKKLHDDNKFTPLLQTEVTWFMKISWNLALLCQDTPVKMKDLFVLCSNLLDLVAHEPGSQSKQLTCMLMSAAACLQVNRELSPETDKKPVLEECLSYLESSKGLMNSLKQQSLNLSEVREKEMDLLMMLYEFEAKIQLKDPSVESVLEKAISVSGPDPKALETLAGTCPGCKLFHSLIQLCLSIGSSEDLNGKEEVWIYYQEILNVIEKYKQGQYPEMEIVWLMTKAWNCGINFFSCSKFSEAEKWCSMSMGMLKYLDSYKSSYESHMSGVYGEILSKVEKQNDRTSLNA